VEHAIYQGWTEVTAKQLALPQPATKPIEEVSALMEYVE
jgi:hypothetical protein